METITATNTICDFDACAEILRAQLSILSKITASQAMVRKAVMSKEWVEFNMLIESMGALAEQEEELEGRRISLFAKLDSSSTRQGQSGSTWFYAFVTRFNDEQRRELTGLYRKLKLEAAKIRMTNDALNRYLTDARVLVSGLVEAAYPQKKGKLYGRGGKLKDADMRSLVLEMKA
ncbi:hypothetical protein FACS189494_11480 [Spirochaetia bacterium]|nr:hypothetical protein FACS189494_11480 [Spirochaetia bacterium]